MFLYLPLDLWWVSKNRVSFQSRVYSHLVGSFKGIGKISTNPWCQRTLLWVVTEGCLRCVGTRPWSPSHTPRSKDVPGESVLGVNDSCGVVDRSEAGSRFLFWTMTEVPWSVNSPTNNKTSRSESWISWIRFLKYAPNFPCYVNRDGSDRLPSTRFYNR